MIQPDENGVITVKTEQQYKSVLSGQRDDFCVLVLEQDGITRRTTDYQTVQKEREQKYQRKLQQRVPNTVDKEQLPN